MGNFSGTKLVLLIGEQVVTLLRDDIAGIPFPGMWDFPGGGREDGETPETCVLRETKEELALVLNFDDLIWKCELDSPTVPGTTSWWFAARLPQGSQDKMTLGDEGQCWMLMDPDEWMEDPRAIPHFKPRLQAALVGLARHALEIKDK